MTIKLDEYDLRLLTSLDSNARRSLSAVARDAKIGRDLTQYRFERFVDLGLITAFVTIINPSRLGWGIFKTYLRLRRAPRSFFKLQQRILSHPRVWCIAACEGRWDLIVSILAIDGVDLFTAQQEVLALVNGDVADLESSIIVQHTSFARVLGKHRAAAKPRAMFAVAGRVTDAALDDISSRLLDAIVRDARRDLSSLAEELDVSPATVENRIRKLEDAGVIVGYRCEMNRELLGLSHFRLHIEESSFEGDLATSLRTWSKNEPLVVSTIQQHGPHRHEVSVEVSSSEALSNILDGLRATHADSIARIETTTFRSHLFRWLPPNLGRTARKRDAADIDTSLLVL